MNQIVGHPRFQNSSHTIVTDEFLILPKYSYIWCTDINFSIYKLLTLFDQVTLALCYKMKMVMPKKRDAV